MSNIQVLLVDDHEVVRAGYRRLLENTIGIKVIAEAKSGEEAYFGYMKHKPDVVIMDLSMPGMSGLEATRKIRHYDDTARILVFSVHENESFLLRALDEGILGYITKRSAAKVMVEAVRQVAQNKEFIGQELHSFLAKNRASGHNPLFDRISSREFEVFLLLAEGKTVNEIAEILTLSSKTVGHHYTHLKNKLKVSNMAELARLAIREGVLEP
ncbi:response regulator transcription factor [Candidatus Parabeggiatoa sp. HSG14]|uniref:response regulator transcription factor n=1 Tax=Candidatus Parabeggiatoa sp. HSG14 TaxID=3055593 RepID=UPI0025A7AF2B|nr:response regulator transcription factor [Thiotrichales bacterium HSG14]